MKIGKTHLRLPPTSASEEFCKIKVFSKVKSSASSGHVWVCEIMVFSKGLLILKTTQPIAKTPPNYLPPHMGPKKTLVTTIVPSSLTSILGGGVALMADGYYRITIILCNSTLR